MDGNDSFPALQFIMNHNIIKRCKGLKVLKLNNILTVWLWSEEKILIYENILLASTEQEKLGSKSPGSSKTEFTLIANIIEVLYWVGEVAYALDESGTIHSFQSSTHSLKSPLQFIDVDDMFGSPQFNEPSLKWVHNSVPVIQIDNCDKVISACQLTSGFVVQVITNEQLVIFVYSYPDFNLLFLLDLDKYIPYTGCNTLKGGVISSCSIASLTLPMKKLFQDNSLGFNSEIIVIGLTSGLVLWFYVGSPLDGPFVLCSVHQQVQGIYWKKDDVSGLFVNLLIVLTSGRTVIFGEKENVTAYLPESVKSSCLFQSYLVTSNLTDCYSSIVLTKNETCLSSFLLAVKGICAMAFCFDTLVVATVHGSLYFLDPTITSSNSLSNFVIPDQVLLDNMFIQTQILEEVYLELSREDDIITAVSITAAVNSIQNPFEVKIKVISDAEFVIIAKLLKTNMVFSHKLWLACVEVSSGKGEKETLLCSLKEDFNRSRDLSLNITRSLSINTTISLELVLYFEKQLPLASVLLDKVGIDACHLISSNVISPNMSCFQASSLDPFLYSHKEVPENQLKKFECAMEIPYYFTTDSIVMTILNDSQHPISSDWSNTSGGNKCSIKVSIMTIPVEFNLNIKSKELTISCCNVQLCHQISEAIVKRLTSIEKKCITENISMDIQALYQAYEIDLLKDKPNISTMNLLWKKLRSAVSFQLPI